MAGGSAQIWISAYVNAQNTPIEGLNLVHLHESGIQKVTFTLSGADTFATGVGLVFAGL
jgi:hypothetical protein